SLSRGTVWSTTLGWQVRDQTSGSSRRHNSSEKWFHDQRRSMASSVRAWRPRGWACWEGLGVTGVLMGMVVDAPRPGSVWVPLVAPRGLGLVVGLLRRGRRKRVAGRRLRDEGLR